METKDTVISKDKALIFRCYFCGYVLRFDSWEDPTSSSGCCKNCGSSQWNITNLIGERII